MRFAAILQGFGRGIFFVCVHIAYIGRVHGANVVPPPRVICSKQAWSTFLRLLAMCALSIDDHGCCEARVAVSSCCYSGGMSRVARIHHLVVDFFKGN